VGEYRLYFFGDDGHIRRAINLEADGDEQAIETADQHANGSAMELWQHARIVAQFPKREMQRSGCP
jgi:hypothetical protein